MTERRRREDERGGEGAGGGEGGLSFLLLINYFRDKRWPAVEKKGESIRERGIETQVFSLALTLSLCPREMPRTNF